MYAPSAPTAGATQGFRRRQSVDRNNEGSPEGTPSAVGTNALPTKGGAKGAPGAAVSRRSPSSQQHTSQSARGPSSSARAPRPAFLSASGPTPSGGGAGAGFPISAAMMARAAGYAATNNGGGSNSARGLPTASATAMVGAPKRPLTVGLGSMGVGGAPMLDVKRPLTQQLPKRGAGPTTIIGGGLAMGQPSVMGMPQRQNYMPTALAGPSSAHAGGPHLPPLSTAISGGGGATNDAGGATTTPTGSAPTTPRGVQSTLRTLALGGGGGVTPPIHMPVVSSAMSPLPLQRVGTADASKGDRPQLVPTPPPQQQPTTMGEPDVSAIGRPTKRGGTPTSTPLAVTPPAAAAAAAALQRYNAAHNGTGVMGGGGRGNSPVGANGNAPMLTTSKQRSAAAAASGGGGGSVGRNCVSVSGYGPMTTDYSGISGIMDGGEHQYTKQRELKLKVNNNMAIADLINSFNNEYYSRRSSAALTIQCAWRSFTARVETFSRRQVFYHYIYVQQKAAVLCLVSFFKGILLRKRRLMVRVNTQRALEERVVRERTQRAAVLKITAAMRRYITNKKETQRLMRLLRLRQEEKLTHYRTAAVIVQRWFRIIRVQKAYWRRRAAEIEAHKAHIREVQRVDGAATMIQKHYRGVLGRRYAAKYKDQVRRDNIAMLRRIKESVDVVRVFLLSFAARKRREATTGERLIVSDDGAKVTAVPLSILDEARRGGGGGGYDSNNADGSGSATPNGGPPGDSTTSTAAPSPLTNALMLKIFERREEQRLMDFQLTQQMVREAQRLVYVRAMETARACATMQRAWRCYKARRELRVKRTIAKTHDVLRVDKEYALYKAVSLVGQCLRQRLSANVRATIIAANHDRFWNGLRAIQRIGHAYVERRRVRQEQVAAINMANQIVWAAARTYTRHVGVISGFFEAMVSEGIVAKLAAKRAVEKEALMVEVRRQVHEDQSAAKIQRLVRSKNARAATKAKVAELTAAKQRIVNAIVKIQSFVRAKIFARREYLQRKRKADFIKWNRALETEIAEAQMLKFLLQFERIEALEREDIAEEEDELFDALISGGLAEVGVAKGNSADDEAIYGNDPYDL